MEKAGKCLRNCLRAVSGTVSEQSRRQFWSADISGRPSKNVFLGPMYPKAGPIYPEGKPKTFFPARYIGKSARYIRKTNQKCFSRPDISESPPDISARQTKNILAGPIYPSTQMAKPRAPSSAPLDFAPAA